MRVDEPKEEVEDDPMDEPIRSPIGSLPRRADAAAGVRAASGTRAGVISTALSSGFVIGEFGAGGFDAV